jgi:nitroimidazol reductase NimA-like FMN-containing flavoprotein (pyridoxamine 5'-phosphate oxidase superfamily)
VTSRGLEILGPDECLRLLRSESFGRVGLRIGEMPTVLPVNYALLDDDVVFRTDPGTKLSAAVMEMLVAFEVDEADAATRTGWSVVVVGYCEEIRDRATRERVAALDLDPWAPEGRDFIVRIRTRKVTGRRLRQPTPPA